MGCVQAKPFEGDSEAKGLERLKLENGYVGNCDFVAHRRSMDQRYGHIKEDREGGSNWWLRNDVLDGEKLARKCFDDDDDEMVDGWPRWLVDNVPPQVLAAFVPRTADSYIMIDKVFLFVFCFKFYVLD